MNSSKELTRGKSLLRVEAEDLCGVPAAPRRSRAGVPFEGRHRPGHQRLLQSRFTLLKRSLAVTTLGKQRSKDERAKRRREDAGLGTQDPLRHRESSVPEITDAKGCRPNDCKGHDKRGCCRENGPTTG